MKWLMHWLTEDEEYGRAYVTEQWASSWEEAVGYFTSWISKTSNVVMGNVTCYMGDQPYGDGKPCLYFNVSIAREEGEE